MLDDGSIRFKYSNGVSKAYSGRYLAYSDNIRPYYWNGAGYTKMSKSSKCSFGKYSNLSKYEDGTVYIKQDICYSKGVMTRFFDINEYKVKKAFEFVPYDNSTRTKYKWYFEALDLGKGEVYLSKDIKNTKAEMDFGIINDWSKEIEKVVRVQRYLNGKMMIELRPVTGKVTYDPEIILREKEKQVSSGRSITVPIFQRTVVRYFIDENYPIEKYNKTCFKTLIANKTKISKNVSLSIADSTLLDSGKLPYVNKGIETEIDYTKENIICHNLIVGNYKVGFASSSVNVTVQNTWIMNNSFYNATRKGIGINLSASLTNATTIPPKLNITGNLSITPFNNFSWTCDEPAGTNCSVRLRGKIAANQSNTTIFLDFDIGNSTILAVGDDRNTIIKDLSFSENDGRVFADIDGLGILVEGRDGTLAFESVMGGGANHPVVKIPHKINQFPNGTGMTIGLWIYLDNTNNNPSDFLMAKSGFGQVSSGYSIRLDNPASRGIDGFRYYNGVSNDNVVCLEYALKNQTWTHIAITYDEVDTIKFYKDGVIIDGCTDTNGIGVLDRTGTGEMRLLTLITSFECQGCTMDDFFFAQRNYSQQEIQNYMNGTHYWQVIKERNYTSPILLGQSANYSIIDAKFFLESNTGNIPYVLNATYGFGGFPAVDEADTSPPTVTLNSPDISYFNDTLSNTTFNCSATDASLVKNISLFLTDFTNASDSFKFNVTNSTYTLEVSYNLTIGNYTWNCESCDALDNCGFSSSNRTVEMRSLGAADSCSCPGSGNFEIINGDECEITTVCDIGTNKFRTLDGRMNIRSGGAIRAGGCFIKDGESLYVEDGGGFYCEG